MPVADGRQPSTLGERRLRSNKGAGAGGGRGALGVAVRVAKGRSRIGLSAATGFERAAAFGAPACGDCRAKLECERGESSGELTAVGDRMADGEIWP